jgi:hypothetical protein
VDSIPLGIEFLPLVSKVIGRCDVLIVLIGKSWVESLHEREGEGQSLGMDYARFEIEEGLISRIPIIPLLIDGASIPRAEELPGALKAIAGFNAQTIRYDPDFHRDMHYLISELKERIPPANDPYNELAVMRRKLLLAKGVRELRVLEFKISNFIKDNPKIVQAKMFLQNVRNAIEREELAGVSYEWRRGPKLG